MTEKLINSEIKHVLPCENYYFEIFEKSNTNIYTYIHAYTQCLE